MILCARIATPLGTMRFTGTEYRPINSLKKEEAQPHMAAGYIDYQMFCDFAISKQYPTSRMEQIRKAVSIEPLLSFARRLQM